MKNKSLALYFSYYANKKKLLLFSISLAAVQAIVLLPIAKLVEYISDTIIPNRDVQALTLVLALMAVLFLINTVATLWNRSITLSIIKSVIYTVRKNLLEQSLYFDRQFFLTEDLDIIHSRIVQDTERVDRLTAILLIQILPSVGIVIGLSCILLYMNPVLFLVVGIVFGLLLIIHKFSRRELKRRTRIFHQHFSEFSKKVSFSLRFNELIKLSTAEKVELEDQNLVLNTLHTASQSLAWMNMAYSAVQQNLLMLCGVIVLLIGGLQVIYETSTLGSILSFYIALGLLSTNMRTIIISSQTITEGIESVETLVALQQKQAPQTNGQQPFSGFKKLITLKNVSFRHSSDFQLSDISFSIKHQEMIGIFGASGSGKSTIISLLLGFFKPHSGTISIDGTDLAEIDTIDYRKHIGVLSQDPLIFPGTIRENLTYGLSHVSKEDLIEACTEAKIYEFISKLTDGFDSVIGERGVKISGGQKQRLAIARALLRKPQLLILDEPDNNLDDETIVSIIKNLKAKKHTVLVISHNQILAPELDRIYQFDATTKQLQEKQ